ncbi:IS110 family transposase [Streptomyces cadmiisoli]|uniref:IS110 family transposase n=1 Tax=Streptomyces cadmiisoli TaxID=2184053 RepID=UPI0013A6A8CA|nr:IS110 family transposase [Streptomyces cadmiisoli]
MTERHRRTVAHPSFTEILPGPRSRVRRHADVLELGDEATWAIDLPDGYASLVITLLVSHGQRPLYIPGRAVNRASGSYRGEGKTDARDALIIADQARMRRDLSPLRAADEAMAELKFLTARRTDLVCDRTRASNRLRGLLAGIFPALERELNLANLGPLTGYQPPGTIRRLGASRLEKWLRGRGARWSAALARTAVEAASHQHTAVPGEQAAARLVQALALELIDLDRKIAELDEEIAKAFRSHPYAEIVTSMPGIGPLLGAEFLAATSGDMALFGSADRLATYAGLAPTPRDSGRVSGNLYCPTRYHRGLQRVFYMSAMSSIHYCPESRCYYQRKGAEGKRHTQAVLALARRRVNVLWALLRDGRRFEPAHPAAGTA